MAKELNVRLWLWDGSAWSLAKPEDATNPNLRVSLYQATKQADIPAGAADGESNALVRLAVAAYKFRYNGSTWDRERNNQEITLLASDARTATTVSPNQVNYNARGIIVYFRISNAPGTDTVTLSIRSTDPVSGVDPKLLEGAALSTTGFRTYILYPGIGPASAEVTAVESRPLPRTWYIQITHVGTGSFTYSVGASYIL